MHAVRVVRHVDETVRDTSTPKSVRHAYVDAYRAPEREGCRAANYRLSGEGEWPAFCVLTLPSGWRMVIDFPEESEIRVLLLVPHDEATDPYSLLAQALGVTRTPGVQNKPPCCDSEGPPPPASSLIESELRAVMPKQRRLRRTR